MVGILRRLGDVSYLLAIFAAVAGDRRGWAVSGGGNTCSGGLRPQRLAVFQQEGRGMSKRAEHLGNLTFASEFDLEPEELDN